MDIRIIESEIPAIKQELYVDKSLHAHQNKHRDLFQFKQ